MKAFTLIELLAVIAIIGLISSVVLAGMRSSREKAQIANIQQSLKSMIGVVELANNGDYSQACIVLVPMIDALEDNGANVGCYVHSGTQYQYKDWAVTAHPLLNRTKNYSVNSSGVVVWDTSGNNSANWNSAASNCASAGKKMPTMEMLEALDLSQLKYGSHSGLGAAPNYGFLAAGYWASTPFPPTVPIPNGYFVPHLMSYPLVGDNATSNRPFRCVR